MGDTEFLATPCARDQQCYAQVRMRLSQLAPNGRTVGLVALAAAMFLAGPGCGGRAIGSSEALDAGRGVIVGRDAALDGNDTNNHQGASSGVLQRPYRWIVGGRVLGGLFVRRNHGRKLVERWLLLLSVFCEGDGSSGGGEHDASIALADGVTLAIRKPAVLESMLLVLAFKCR